MIARVVVDVPSGQTDRLFDYKIPAEWSHILEKGMRVVVPFGPRSIQGFVVEIIETSTVDKLKEIKDILDVTPVLTEELLKLGDWLTEQTLSYKISAYQVMLPAALKTKVEKKLVCLKPQHLPFLLQPFFEKQSIMSWNEIVETNPSLLKTIKEAVKEGLLEVEYSVKDKGKKQTHRMIECLFSKEQLVSLIDTLPQRAEKQIAIVHYFMNNVGKVPLIRLIELTDSSRSSVKALVDKGILIEKDEEFYRDPFLNEQFEQTKPLPLTEQQQQVTIPILTSIEENVHHTFLLHGVTGSGKTEIYLQVIERALSKGQEAIVLVPEISLTPQMVERFKGRFGSQVAVLHSGLSLGEKYDEWRKIHRKEVRVAVGARSAIFAPFENLGVIIIDEEHEGSYKQEEMPRYHARDVAIFRGQFYHCPVILGSATPSLETFARAKVGRYELLTLGVRVNKGPLPTVDVVDMREELRAGNRSMFSIALFEKMQDRLNKKEQMVLLLNRRGFSTFVMCRDCGFVATCEHCDISFTYHKSNHSLKCHYCGHEERMISTCPSCASEHVRFFGTGTQRVEEELGKVLPEARVIRMDVDTTRRKGAHQKLLKDFGNGKADILLGTQMIAKGLDFPNITLVGVLTADTMLHLPDFRSSERTFQLLTQVSGRAGRHKLPGEVIVQTYTPEHYSIELVKEHDYVSFFQREMFIRKNSGYPPYFHIALINVSHQELPKVIHVTEKITHFIKEQLSNEANVLGPVASPVARIKDRYRYQCMIKYKNEPALGKILREIQQHYSREVSQGELLISIDMNPQMFM
ncbi:primosomal protein N' [Alkalihalobacterium alkalinitrilicum]|uniref:primosomal protein N' n=1 Tax=Alkalihalobacterium alkalinitrilicum TaxID=427920 RepID=UPI000994EF24|nr:primosomal protein N' [Alkalihalobacterium alkalinitrilicum]